MNTKKYTYNIIKGAMARHRELLNKITTGEIKSLYRRREEILEMKNPKVEDPQTHGS